MRDGTVEHFPGRVKSTSQGVRPRWPMLLECMYSRPSRIWMMMRATSISVMYFSCVTVSSSSPPVASSEISVISSRASYTSINLVVVVVVTLQGYQIVIVGRFKMRFSIYVLHSYTGTVMK